MHTHHFTELLFVSQVEEGSCSFNHEHIGPLRAGESGHHPAYTQNNTERYPLKINRWNIMCSELMELHSCPKKTEKAHRYSGNYEHDPSIQELFRQMHLRKPDRTIRFSDHLPASALRFWILKDRYDPNSHIAVSINAIRMTKECAQIKAIPGTQTMQNTYGWINTLTGFLTHMKQILYGCTLFTKICRISPQFE